MLALTLKSLLGAFAVLLIAFLSKSKIFYIAGLVPLFPTFALIAHYIVGTERPAQDLRTTALFGLLSLLPYAIYLFTVFMMSIRTDIVRTLSYAALTWFLSAGLLLFIWTHWFTSK